MSNNLLRKCAVNLTIGAQLLEDARAFGVPLSATLEEALVVRVRAAKQARWLAENAGAIEDYNQRIAQDGTFGGSFGNI